jgi:hypothetical protein
LYLSYGNLSGPTGASCFFFLLDFIFPIELFYTKSCFFKTPIHARALGICIDNDYYILCVLCVLCVKQKTQNLLK